MAPPPEQNDQIAAVDLGSNSFHLIVGRFSQGRLTILDRLRESVRLGAGLDDDNRLTRASREVALDCLRRFGQRLRGIPSGRVRAVGTNTLRKARNGRDFLVEAQRALGHPIEVIAGREEARLIYLGVANGLADDGGQRLVMDIGGGSTELIIGERFSPRYLESLHMGCVSMSRRFFDDGRVDSKQMRRALLAARQELEPIETTYRRIGWESAVGASGTIRAIGSVLQANGWGHGEITREGLQQLHAALLERGKQGTLAELAGLSPERVAVFPGGFAVLYATFEALGIRTMQVSDMALREGLIHDLLGRLEHHDVREATIDALKERHQVDRAQSHRVEATALDLLAQCADGWQLNDERHQLHLGWAARLHEIGLAIAHSQYHKHGAYLLAHSDLPGFSRREQRVLAALVRCHRRKFRNEVFDELPDEERLPAIRLTLLLRLAVLLHRGRAEEPPPTPSLAIDAKAITLRFPPGWLDAHPLTRADLDEEASLIRQARLRLHFS